MELATTKLKGPFWLSRADILSPEVRRTKHAPSAACEGSCQGPGPQGANLRSLVEPPPGEVSLAWPLSNALAVDLALAEPETLARIQRLPTLAPTASCLSRGCVELLSSAMRTGGHSN